MHLLAMCDGKSIARADQESHERDKTQYAHLRICHIGASVQSSQRLESLSKESDLVVINKQSFLAQFRSSPCFVGVSFCIIPYI
jgi:hypothetical protein